MADASDKPQHPSPSPVEKTPVWLWKPARSPGCRSTAAWSEFTGMSSKQHPHENFVRQLRGKESSNCWNESRKPTPPPCFSQHPRLPLSPPFFRSLHWVEGLARLASYPQPCPNFWHENTHNFAAQWYATLMAAPGNIVSMIEGISTIKWSKGLAVDFSLLWRQKVGNEKSRLAQRTSKNWTLHFYLEVRAKSSQSRLLWHGCINWVLLCVRPCH